MTDDVVGTNPGILRIEAAPTGKNPGIFRIEAAPTGKNPGIFCDLGKHSSKEVLDDILVGDEIVEFPDTSNKTGALEYCPLLDEYHPWSFSDDGELDTDIDNMMLIEAESRKRPTPHADNNLTMLLLTNGDSDSPSKKHRK